MIDDPRAFERLIDRWRSCPTGCERELETAMRGAGVPHEMIMFARVAANILLKDVQTSHQGGKV